MSQHDMVIDDADGATFLADLNNALPALASTSKGSAAPSTLYAGQQWIDDDTPSSTKWSRHVYDGTDSIKVGEIDVTNNVAVQQVGGGSAQSVASATTTDLGSVFEATVVVTGTTTITSFDSNAPLGAFKFVEFSGALTLTHNATSLILPSAANVTTAAGDTLIAEHLGSGNWRVHHYTRANGTPVGGASYYVGNTTYGLTTATGTQAVTGVGFKPKAVILFGGVTGTSQVSWGFSDAATHRAVYDNNVATAGTYGTGSANVAFVQTSSGNSQAATISSFDADGFTLSWTKTGSPTGTATLNFLCLR